MSHQLTPRPWVPEAAEDLVQSIASTTATSSSAELDERLDTLIRENREIHESDCINLNPATNVMNPRAEAVLSSGLGTRPSLGYPGEKYEMGLEAIEQIEVITAELAAEVFNASYAEVRVPSGALANLYAFMALSNPGDTIIVPPATVGGHVTHHDAGAAGLYKLNIYEAPIDAQSYTVDVDALATVARELSPKVITIGSSLNLSHHDVEAIRSVADSVGAKVLFDAAHLSGVIAGGAWPNPLDQGAHVMTMSTYKSLGGPPAGLLLTNDAEIAERVDAIAYPGLTANFDVAKTAALAITLLDWRRHGAAYANEMTSCAALLEQSISDRGIPTYGSGTKSHAFAIDASRWGGGHEAAQVLRKANLLTCAIGLPTSASAGLRIGTNEIVRWGMKTSDMDHLASLIARAVDNPDIARDGVVEMRRAFSALHYVST